MLEPRTPARRIGIFDAFEPLADASVVACRPLGPQARFVLRLAAADAARLGHLGGLDLGGPINRASSVERRIAARLGPDEWLLLAPECDATTFHDAASTALAGTHHTLVDISHRNAAIEISGHAAPDVLNAGCTLDLGKFQPADATRTLLGKVEIVLIRLDDVAGAPCYRIEFWRSFGRFLHAYLAEAAREFG